MKRYTLCHFPVMSKLASAGPVGWKSAPVAPMFESSPLLIKPSQHGTIAVLGD